MDDFCRLPSAERRPYFETAATNSGLPIGIIEKDFWVCWTLKRLFSLHGIDEHLIFKGGTTLSKVYGVIERFSEDIDISIDRQVLGFEGVRDPEKTESTKKQRKLIEELASACRQFVTIRLLTDLRDSIGNAMGTMKGWDIVVDDNDPDGQTLLFHYPIVETTNEAYIRPSVKIEMGARSDHWPAHEHSVTP
jgi:hypothetical protein